MSWLHDQPNGPLIVFLLLLIIWASDVGAYFSWQAIWQAQTGARNQPEKNLGGRLRRYCPGHCRRIPLVELIAGLNIPAGALLTMTVLTALASVGGDLFISIHKRTVGLKDTGTIFPGHGGILDRYDSLLAGAPFFALAYGILAQ